MVCLFTGLCLFISMIVHGAGIYFDNQSIARSVCFYGDEIYPRIIDHTSAQNGDESVTYFLTGTNGCVSINSTTGYIYLNQTDMKNISQNALIAKKHARDNSGKDAVLTMAFTFVEGRMFNETCPQTLYFDVRQIAPVGEEIGVVECRDMTMFNGSVVRTRFKKLLVSEGNYAPFNITNKGVVVVSDRLVLYNSIRDITIFNVMLTSDVIFNGSENCTRVTTHVTTVITVKETDCQNNWTYILTQNLYVDALPVFVLMTSSIPACMWNCSSRKSPVCNSFLFNVLTDTCYILNDTAGTRPNKTRTRMGYFYYHKRCDTEILPTIHLRNLAEKAKRNQSIDDLADIADTLTVVIDGLSNHTRDIDQAIDILKLLVQQATGGRVKLDEIKKYIKVVSRCFELLFTLMGDGQDYKQSVLRLLEIFDGFVTLISRLTMINQKTLGMPGNMTSLQLVNARLTNVSTTPVLLRVSNEQSGFTLQTMDTASNVAVGILKMVPKFGLPEWSTNSSDFTDGCQSCLYYLASHVMAVAMSPLPSTPAFQVQLEIYTAINGYDSNSQRICAFLFTNHSEAGSIIWSTTGCSLAGYNKTHTHCVCSHLTNFAVLMQVRTFKLSKVHEMSLSVVTMIGCCISIAALTTSLLVLLWLRFQSDRYVLLMNLTLAIILAQVVFLTGIDAVHNKSLCRVIAISLHYLYLAVFTLMLAQGIHLYHKLYRAFAVDTNVSMFLVLGWGSPFAIIAISVITNLGGYGTDERCWLSTDGAIWAFVGPALTVIAINMAILVMIIRTFLGVKFNANKTDVDKFKASVRATAVLLPLLGVTWMFGIAAVNGSTVVFQYVFAILNSLQGLFIFLFHVVFNEEVREACSRYKGRVITVISNITPPDTRPN